MSFSAFLSTKKRYHPIPQGTQDADKSESQELYRSYHRAWFPLIALVVITSSLLSALVTREILTINRPTEHRRPSSTCARPAVRREWRSLSTAEKRDYIQAVQCLTATPSRLGLNQSMYHDFPFVHYTTGEYSHESAPFLVWHRYFLHIYEKSLKEECNYTGFLTYWDWTLDWENITKSPVWDEELGFGGDGLTFSDIPKAIPGGCVSSGPFAGLEVLYYNETYGPHCLTRGFASRKVQEALGKFLAPSMMDRVSRASTYHRFNLNLEDGPHNAIPLIVRGDFAFLTAPSDPVFFLHHTQLDRLWWKWQQENPGKRLMEYNGNAEYGSNREASLDDMIRMGGLAPDLPVRDFMGTESGDLCYRY